MVAKEIELDNGRSEFECVQQLGVVQVRVEGVESYLEGWKKRERVRQDRAYEN